MDRPIAKAASAAAFWVGAALVAWAVSWRGRHTAHPLPPAAPGVPPRTALLTPLEARVLRACAVPEGAPGDACSLGSALARLQAAARPGARLCGPCGAGEAQLARCLARAASPPRILSLTPFLLQHRCDEHAALLIAAAFSLARKLAPCIVLCDSMEALLPRRDCAPTSAPAREFTANFLCAWEDTCSGSGSCRGEAWVLVMGACARRADIDAGALMLLDCQMDLPLADCGARARQRALLRGER